MENEWSEWRRFPNPNKNEYLYAPFGCGVYQLRNTKIEKNVLFGKSKNVSARMTSLLPHENGGLEEEIIQEKENMFWIILMI